LVVVELAELIGDLRDELTRAVAAANAPDGLRFELGPVGLEVTVAVAKEAKPGAKVKFWVVEAGAEGSISKTATQKITLTLQPTVAGGSAYVSGAAEADEN
jgi:hypothetical protein